MDILVIHNLVGKKLKKLVNYDKDSIKESFSLPKIPKMIQKIPFLVKIT